MSSSAQSKACSGILEQAQTRRVRARVLGEEASFEPRVQARVTRAVRLPSKPRGLAPPRLTDPGAY